MSGFSRKYKPAYKSKDKIPEKYFEGLNTKERALMTKEILQRPQSLKYWSADKAYTKRLRKEKETLPKGQYAIAFHKKYGKENGKSLQRISRVTGIRLAILKEVEKRAYGAWSSGHKPGVFPSQWARSRVYSFVMNGKTRKTADKDLWELHLKDLKKKKKNPQNQSLLNRISLPYDKQGHIYYYDIILDGTKNIGTVRYDSIKNEQDIIIDEPYQKQGIGTLVYDTIEKQFRVKLKPSDSLSYGGIEFWKKRKVD